ncbi:MAG: hypothetical protein ACYCZJ_15470 [Sulfuriferula sp.]
MARKRRRGSIADALNAFASTYKLTSGVMQDREMAKVADAKPEEVAKVRDATDGEIASAKAETDAIAAQDAQTFGESAGDYGMGSKVQDGTSFRYLGNDYDTAPTAGQQSAARLAAQAGVLERYGDISGAVKLRAAGVQADETERSREYQDDMRSVFAGGIQGAIAKSGQPAARSAAGGIQGAVAIPGKPAQPAASALSATQPTIPGTPPTTSGSQPSQPGAASTQSTQQADEDVGLDRYLQKVAPQAIQTMLKHGRPEDAQKFQQFVDSERGRTYAKRWLGGVRMLSIGDNHGAIKAFERMYNDQTYGDDRTVKLVPSEDGSQYAVEQYDQDGNLLVSVTKSTADLAKEAALALEPSTAVKFLAEQEGKRAAEAAALEKQTLIEDRKDGRETVKDAARDQRDAEREDRRDARQGRQLASMERRLSGDRITPAQDANNKEIDAARRRLTGMSADDVRRKTQPYTATGRENPDYDPQLAATARLANQRKVGDDQTFDEFSAPKPKPATPQTFDRQEVAKRFRYDKSMNAYKLGKDTPNGVEVLDKSGKLLGHYR